MVDVVLQEEIRLAGCRISASALRGESSQKPGISTRLLIGSISRRMPCAARRGAAWRRLARNTAATSASVQSAGGMPASALTRLQPSVSA